MGVCPLVLKGQYSQTGLPEAQQGVLEPVCVGLCGKWCVVVSV